MVPEGRRAGKGILVSSVFQETEFWGVSDDPVLGQGFSLSCACVCLHPHSGDTSWAQVFFCSTEVQHGPGFVSFRGFWI